MDRALADFGEADAPDRYVPRGTIELLAVAIRTVKIGHAGNEAVAGAIRCGLSVGFLQTRNDAFPRFAVLVLGTVFGGEFVMNDGRA